MMLRNDVMADGHRPHLAMRTAPQRSVAAVLVASAMAALTLGSFAFSTTQLLDPDFGWRLRTGEWILEHRTLPTQDLFSFTMPDYPWVDHAWLADVIFAWSLSHLSYEALGVLMAAIVAIPFLWWYARVRTAWEAVVVGWGAASLMPFLVGIRAQYFSFVFFFLLWRILEAARRHRASLLLLPPFFFLWSSVHGGFIVGLAYCAAVAACRGVTWSSRLVIRREGIRIAAALLVSTAATLLNPYGLRLYREIIRNIVSSDNARFIAEWQPLPLLGFQLPVLLIVLAAVTFAAVWFWHRCSNEMRILPAVFALAALTSVRHWQFFLLVALPLAVATTRYAAADIRAAAPTLRMVRIGSAGIIVATIIVGFLTWREVSTAEASTRIVRQQELINRLAQLSGEHTRMLNDYGLGGWMIWKAPHLKTFIDGRMPYWSDNSHSAMRDYLDILRGDILPQRVIAQYGVNAALLRKPPEPHVTALNRWFASALAVLSEQRGSTRRDVSPPKNGRQEFIAALLKLNWEIAYEDDATMLLVAPSTLDENP